MFSWSWCCRSPPLKSIFHSKQPASASLKAIAHSLFLRAPWPLFWCCSHLSILSYRRRTDQIFCWYHSSTPYRPASMLWHPKTIQNRSPFLHSPILRSFGRLLDFWIRIPGFASLISIIWVMMDGYLGSILPVAYVSNKLKASLSSSISS